MELVPFEHTIWVQRVNGLVFSELLLWNGVPIGLKFRGRDGCKANAPWNWDFGVPWFFDPAGPEGEPYIVNPFFAPEFLDPSGVQPCPWIIRESSRRASHCLRVMGLWLFAIVLPMSSLAQSPPVDVSGAYAVLWMEQQTFPFGWQADIAAAVTPRWGITGEVGGMYDRRRIDSQLQFRMTIDGALHSGMFGGRLRVLRHKRMRLFGQMLIGAVRTSSTTRFEAIMPGQSVLSAGDFESSSTRFALQPGAGLTIPLSERIGARVRIDYRRVVLDDGSSAGAHTVRLAGGVAFSLGPS